MPPAVPSAQSMCGTTYTYAVLAPFTDETGDAITLLYAACAVVAPTFLVFLADAHAHLHNAVFPS